MQSIRKNIKRFVFSAALISGTLLCGNASADNVQMALNPATTVIYMKSNITNGYITGQTATDFLWHYTGDVYAAVVNPATGVQSSPVVKIGTVTGNPTFPMDKFGLLTSGDPIGVAQTLNSETMPWTCASCTLSIGGSTFAKIPNMPLTARAFLGLGPVANAENKLALRMGGCAGVQEISGQGKYANKKGTLCMNGTIGFNQDFSGVGTSNCVMVLQDGPYSPTVNE